MLVYCNFCKKEFNIEPQRMSEVYICEYCLMAAMTVNEPSNITYIYPIIMEKQNNVAVH